MYSVSLNNNSVEELEALRSKLSDIFSSDNTDNLKVEIELEKHIDGDKVELKVKTEGGWDNQHLPFNSNAVFNDYLGMSDTVIAGISSNFDNVTKVKREFEVEMPRLALQASGTRSR
jgi:hypothetical protein